MQVAIQVLCFCFIDPTLLLFLEDREIVYKPGPVIERQRTPKQLVFKDSNQRSWCIV